MHVCSHDLSSVVFRLPAFDHWSESHWTILSLSLSFSRALGFEDIDIPTHTAIINVTVARLYQHIGQSLLLSSCRICTCISIIIIISHFVIISSVELEGVSQVVRNVGILLVACVATGMIVRTYPYVRFAPVGVAFDTRIHMYLFGVRVLRGVWLAPGRKDNQEQPACGQTWTLELSLNRSFGDSDKHTHARNGRNVRTPCSWYRAVSGLSTESADSLAFGDHNIMQSQVPPPTVCPIVARTGLVPPLCLLHF